MRKFIALILVVAATAVAQDSTVHGTITYVAGDAVYTSIGRNAGVKDSTVLYVVSKLDTIAVLKVFGTSSKSSVCHVISKKRDVAIDEPVVGRIRHEVPSRTEITKNDSVKPSQQPIVPTPEIIKSTIAPKPLVSVQGRLSLQYFRNVYTTANQTITQPGIVIDLRGKANDLPLKFEVYGNVRSATNGNQFLFASSSVNRSRIYRLTIEYDDNTNRISIGRLIPSSAPSVGYTDGLLVTRKFGDLFVGTTLGYEPSYTQRTVSTTMKKFSLFGGYTSDKFARTSVGIAYARTYYYSNINREVVSSNLNIFPTNELFLTAMADVDLRTPRANQFPLKPKLTLLYADVNYRPLTYLTIGVGLNAWRPIYSFESIAALPDSMIDQTLRSNPNVSLNLLLPGGVSVYNTYTPRSSDNGFGREYSNYSSVGISNLLERGVSLRATGNVSVTSLSSTRGYGATVQKSFLTIGEVYIRYQTYRYELHKGGDISTSKSIALDFLLNTLPRTSVWGSIERLIGLGSDGYSISGDVSWRF